MSAFITPSAPVLRTSPPTGLGWVHEVKFDGWRVQLHKGIMSEKHNQPAKVYSRNGADFTSRFHLIATAIAALPCKSAVIDAELVACDLQGQPDFRALMSRVANPDLCCWCFDLLELDGSDLRSLPLVERKARLSALIHKADLHALRYSDHFEDGEALLTEMARRNMEGIVSKKADQSYRSGKNPGWIKVKTAEWKAANRKRFEMFRAK
jgi:bifunctional non-homologous end joining protein LigD